MKTKIAGTPEGVTFLKEIRYPAACLTCEQVVDGRSKAGGFWVKDRGLIHTACAPREWFLSEGSCTKCGNGRGSHARWCVGAGGPGFAPGWICKCGHKGKDHFRTREGDRHVCTADVAGSGAGRTGVHTTAVCRCDGFEGA